MQVGFLNVGTTWYLCILTICIVDYYFFLFDDEVAEDELDDKDSLVDWTKRP